MSRLAKVAVGVALCVGAASAAYYADVAFVIDQSGSMGGEFAWIGNSINQISTTFTGAGVTANWGLAGYEFNAGSASAKNIWVDLNPNAASIVGAVGSKPLYGGIERHYDAVDWSIDNFSWSGGDYAKVMILVTDEAGNYLSNYTYGGLYGEAAIAKNVEDNNILLNVITSTSYYQYWDGAVYSVANDPMTPANEYYRGLFDLNYLRTNPNGFTNTFAAAKLQEIKDYVPTVPEPATLSMLGLGLLGMLFATRRKQS